MANYGRNKQLGAFHAAFTKKRDHKVDAKYMGGGNLGGYYECGTCGEMLEHGGRTHQARLRSDVER